MEFDKARFAHNLRAMENELPSRVDLCFASVRHAVASQISRNLTEPAFGIVNAKKGLR